MIRLYSPRPARGNSQLHTGACATRKRVVFFYRLCTIVAGGQMENW